VAKPNLSEKDCADLAAELRRLVEADRFPFSPRVRRLKELLDKLCPPQAEVVPLPPPKPPGEKSWAMRKKRRH